MRRLPWLRIAFGLALIATLVFGARLVTQAVYWNDPRHQDQAIEGWMRLGYVARSWDVPPEILRDATGLPLAQTGGRTLDDIAQRLEVSLPELIETLQRAIDGHREAPRAGGS